jgi:hypothetical protein
VLLAVVTVVAEIARMVIVTLETTLIVLVVAVLVVQQLTAAVCKAAVPLVTAVIEYKLVAAVALLTHNIHSSYHIIAYTSHISCIHTYI